MFRNLIERMLFAGGTYMSDENGGWKRNLTRNIPVGLIFTMNVSEDMLEQFNYPTILGANETYLNMIYGYCETVYSCDTYQFSDYSKYDCNVFSEEHKRHVKETQFPKDLSKAFDLGKRLVEKSA
jgi:putative NADPH-quinone reductase